MLRAKTALVIGAQTSIGHAISDRLSQSGMQVTPSENGTATPSELTSLLELADGFDVVVWLEPEQSQGFVEAILAAETVARAALPRFRARQFGRLVFVLGAPTGLANLHSPERLTRHGGIVGLTRALARSSAPDGITVNAVLPGPVVSDPLLPGSADLHALIQRTPLQRAGKPEEVAALVAMLCAEEARYVTGQCLCVDGGLS